VTVIFGTAAWIQSDDSHKSLLLAKWQSCVSFPDNPVSLIFVTNISNKGS
jgi:hypothetical protein